MTWTQAALDLLTQYGYLGLFVFMFLETSMVFPFLPSEVVVPFAAGLLVTSPPGIAVFALVAAAGATVGSLFAYYVFGTAGATVAERYGRYVHVSQDEIDRSRRWFRRWGESSVCWGRLLPVLRSIISIPAGFAGMSLGRFTLYTAVGAFLFDLGVAALVYVGKQQSIYAVLVGALRNSVTEGMGYVSANPLASLPWIVSIGLLLVAWWWVSRRVRLGD